MRSRQPNDKTSAATAAAWNAAFAAFEAAETAHDEACEAAGIYRGAMVNPPAETLEAYRAARLALLSAPAPDSDALAYKIAVLVHGFTSLDGDLRHEDSRRWVAEHGDCGDRAALGIYLDVLRLGQPPSPWPAFAHLDADGFRRWAKAEMGQPGRSYAALGEAMGLNRDNAWQVVAGGREPTLRQLIGAAGYFAAP